MTKFKKHSEVTVGRVIAAIIFALFMTVIIVYAIYYDPNKEFSNSFFDDVSNAVRWR